jgi:hypothetical protein
LSMFTTGLWKDKGSIAICFVLWITIRTRILPVKID